MNRLLEEIDLQTIKTGAVFLIERAASFYEGACVALTEILGPGPLSREAWEISADLTEIGRRARVLETASAEALAKVKP
jgi:hypothetical protein